MGKVFYCEKCGFTGYVLFRKKCKNCGIKFKILPDEMKQKYNIFTDDWAEIVRTLHACSNLTFITTFQHELNLREELVTRESKFVMNELASNPLFSKEKFEAQIQEQRELNYYITERNHKKINERINQNVARMQKQADKVNCIPRCPICGSSNIHKITVGTRVVKTAVFGAIGAVDDAGKTWQCDNCDSKF